MKRFFRTFYGKISLIFFVLLILLGGIQTFISVNSSMNFVCETDQTLNRNLARNLAVKFEPFVKDSINFAGVEPIIHELMLMNPRVEIYLLDPLGNLAAYFSDPVKIKRKHINLLPIKKFINPGLNARYPIMGDDPKSLKREKVFSAASLDMGSKGKGYIYIILGSEIYDNAINGVGGSYILSTTALTFGIILFFGGILGSILFFNLTKRLRKMTVAVKEFEKGNYGERIEVKSSDEVGQLTFAFNHMADTITGNIEELKQNDILRRELISNISHDLRSPLASIQGYIETILMRDDKLSIDERKHFLEIILRGVLNLNNLVNELFELSKLDASQAKVNLEPLGIAELVQDIVLKFQPQAEDKKINLITKMPKNVPLVLGDIAMIDRVISNLIDNALRYTPENGKVVIDMKLENDELCINIRDNGNGIPAKDVDHIFDRFYRVEKSRSKNLGGSGLGLAIVKKIVEAHHSKINVISELNKGTQFSFTLKLYQNEPAPVLNKSSIYATKLKQDI